MATTLAAFHQIERDVNHLTREWALETHGWAKLPGGSGGWIYDAQGRTVAQGWGYLWNRYQPQIRDWLTRKLTAFERFGELVTTKPTYRPTIFVVNGRGQRDWRAVMLADMYDHWMEAQHDPRRAYRAGTMRRVPQEGV